MKKHKFGQRVQNWHRPLGPDQLRRRFLRQREMEPAASPRAMQAILDDACEPNMCCEGYPYCGGEYCESYALTPQCIAAVNLFSDMFPGYSPMFRPEWAVDGDKSIIGAGNCKADIEPIEIRLAKHVHGIENLFSDNQDLRLDIRSAIGTQSTLSTLRRFTSRLRMAQWDKLLGLFAPFWIRRPESWSLADKGGDFGSLLAHLFCRYEAPRFSCSHIGYGQSDELQYKWLLWTILIGQGASLKRAGKRFGWRIPEGFQHHLLSLPGDCSVEDACLYADIKRLGGTISDYARLRNVLPLMIDSTCPSCDDAALVFRNESIAWVVRHRDEMTDDDCRLIMAWAVHEHTECERRGGAGFSWKGRTVGAARTRGREYAESRLRPWSALSWGAKGWNWEYEDEASRKWSFVELTSGYALYLEGRILNHCVAGYAWKCAGNQARIVSLRQGDDHAITIELKMPDNRIVQARGRWNRPATATEQQIISRWHRTVVQGRADA